MGYSNYPAALYGTLLHVLLLQHAHFALYVAVPGGRSTRSWTLFFGASCGEIRLHTCSGFCFSGLSLRFSLFTGLPLRTALPTAAGTEKVFSYVYPFSGRSGGASPGGRRGGQGSRTTPGDALGEALTRCSPPRGAQRGAAAGRQPAYHRLCLEPTRFESQPSN